jgi:hypothetical protein
MASLAFCSPLQAQDVVDATSMNHKIMAGYQGWFRTPGDNNGNTGWSHLFKSNTPSAANLSFDTWPDMGELDTDEKAAVPGFTHPDGSQAYLFSAQNPKTVLRHFKWMKEYGIDGVWLSQFCSGFPRVGKSINPSMLPIMNNVRAAATATGRTWAFMWDLTSLPPSEVYTTLTNQWKKMVDEGVTSDPRYMHHNGKPVLLIWGFYVDRPNSFPEICNPLIAFLQAPGKYQATIVGGVDPTWRARGTPEFQKMVMSLTAIQPWSVGRRITDSTTNYKIQNTTLWDGDIAKCKENNVIFIPVLNSGTHKAGPPPPTADLISVPRRMGNYLWEQFIQASKKGVINSAFIAMFDEINEGTQIFKVTNKPPVQAPFITYEGATNDYYLRLVGYGGKLLKSGAPVPATNPISPFNAIKWYQIKNKASGLILHNIRKTAKAPIVQVEVKGANSEWQLVYDGKGYFKIKSKLSGKMLASSAGDSVIQSADIKADNLKWHMEWDGTGFCRIINKKSGKALGNNGLTTAGSIVGQVADVKDSDELHWQIIEE